MALTINTMINDGGGKRRPEADEAVARFEEIQANKAAANAMGNAANGYANPNEFATVTPTAPTAPVTSTAPSYTGGGGVSVTPSAPATPAPEATPYAYNGWQAPTLTPSADKSDYIKELYKMQQDASLKALEDAYNKSMQGLVVRAEKIPDVYYEANRVQQGADARAQQATNEYFAARGLNTGTAGQAALAQNAVRQQNTAAINQAEADALAAVEADRSAIMMDYQAQVRQAIANNEMEKAAALNEEAMRVEQSITDTALKQAELDYKQYQLERADAEARAQMLASMGDFSGYKALGYTDAEVAAMQAYYDAARTPVYYAGPVESDEPNFTSYRAIELYNNLMSGAMTPTQVGYKALSALNNGNITPDEADALSKIANAADAQ